MSIRRLSMLALWVLALAGCAAPMAQTPHVVWVSGERAYVALRDSTALTAGDRVHFQRGGRTVASGVVTRVERGEMAQVMVTSGSLGAPRELARTTVVPEPSPLVTPSMMRIGLPSSVRGTPFFACQRVGIQPQWPESAYRRDAPSLRLARFVRNRAILIDRAWPDTLLIRFYDEGADEEIAIERGELDVAVFWPGELSSHMRASQVWGSLLMGIRSQGAVALVRDGFSSIDSVGLEREGTGTFAALNRDLFHGDLLMSGGSPHPIDPDSGGHADGHPRFQVSPGCPGRAELQRYIDRRVPAPWAGLVRIEYQGNLRFGPGNLPSQGGTAVTPLFAIRCPIVCRPDLRAYLEALGPDPLADLIDCSP